MRFHKCLAQFTQFSFVLPIAIGSLYIVSTHIISKKMALLLNKVRHMIDFNLGELIFSHIMGFAKKKEVKIHLLFPSLIFEMLQSQGFEPYKNEPLLDISGKYTVELRLCQGRHYDDCASFQTLLVPTVGLVSGATPSGSPHMPVSRSASSELHELEVIPSFRTRVHAYHTTLPYISDKGLFV